MRIAPPQHRPRAAIAPLVRLIAAISTALALAGCTSLDAVYGSASMIVANAQSTIDLPPGGVAVPMRYSDGHAVVEAALGDAEPLSLLVDSGSSGPIFFEGVDPGIDGLPVQGTARFNALGSTRPQAVPRVAVAGLRIGALSLGPLQGLRIPRPAAAPAGIDGVLGRDLFQSAVVTFDFPAGVLRFERATDTAGADATARNALRRDGLAWVMDARLSIGGEAHDLVLKFDTGCARPGIVWFSADPERVLPHLESATVSRAGLGGAVAVRSVRGEALRVGTQVFEPVAVDLVARGPGTPGSDYDGLLCLPLWSRGTLRVDAATGWWSWTPR